MNLPLVIYIVPRPALALRLFSLTLLLFATGCLPHSCERDEEHALFPSDSLSREVAAGVPADTLSSAWRATEAGAHPFHLPRTVLFDDSGQLYVSDAEAERVYHFDERGELVQAITSDHFEAPYLAGLRGDTVLVLSPFARRIDAFVDGAPVGELELPVELPQSSPLLWATATGDEVYVKILGENTEGYVTQVNRRGEAVGRHALPGPLWRRAGMLRTWGDSLLSLSGYRPVVDVLPRDLSSNPAAAPDTMALVGFDSPMLGRSRAFIEGDVNQPPVLTESAAPAGEHLFVLNARPGWLQIDVYDRAGQLQHRLTHGDIGLRRNFYPRDLDVRARSDGSYDLAVAFSEPQPLVEVYRWHPQSDGRATAAAEE